MIMQLEKQLFVLVSMQFKVVGVVADFNYASVKQKIAPLDDVAWREFWRLDYKN